MGEYIKGPTCVDVLAKIAIQCIDSGDLVGGKMRCGRNQEGPVDGRDDEHHLGKGAIWSARWCVGFLTGINIIKSVLLT